MQVPSDRHELFVEQLNRSKWRSWLHSLSVRKLITTQSLPVLSCSEYALPHLAGASSNYVILRQFCDVLYKFFVFHCEKRYAAPVVHINLFH
jgi:hypothetical protein